MLRDGNPWALSIEILSQFAQGMNGQIPHNTAGDDAEDVDDRESQSKRKTYNTVQQKEEQHDAGDNESANAHLSIHRHTSDRWHDITPRSPDESDDNIVQARW